MSFQNANLGIATQKFINDYGNIGRTYTALDYFLRVSAANTAVQLDPTNFTYQPGKKASVKINYFPIQCDVEGSCNDGLCDDGDAIEPVQRMFDITQCTATKKVRVNETDVRKTSNGLWDFSGVAQQALRSMLPAARKLLASDMLTYAYTKAGLQADGNTTRRIQSTDVSTGIINPIGKLSIEKDFLDAGMMQPMILGNDELYYFKEMVNIGGTNNNGQNINRLNTANIWYDDGLQGQILGDLNNGGHVLAIDPQVFKLVFFHENAGIFRTDLDRIEQMDRLYKDGNGEGFILGSLVDPATGIVWDLSINFTKCHQDTGRPAWTFQLKLQWDMFVMPDITCNIQGYNGIVHYRTCPPVMAPCPTGDAVPSPASATVRNWNPTFSYPLSVYEATVGGVKTTFNDPVVLTADADTVALLNDVYGASIFTLSGSNIRYTGYTALTVNLNNGAVTGTFA